jgi:hypothetical protein
VVPWATARPYPQKAYFAGWRINWRTGAKFNDNWIDGLGAARVVADRTEFVLSPVAAALLDEFISRPSPFVD